MSTHKESSAAGTDNRPPMLVESDYESWRIRIERYIHGKPLGEAAVQVTRDKRDEEFTEIENNKELADIQATNILRNESIHDYFVRFHKLINDMKITQLDIPTHQMNTKFVNNLPLYWANIVDPLAYLAQTTHNHAPTQTTTLPPPQYGPLTSSTPQQVPQSSNDAMLATMNQIINLLSGFQKQFPPTNNKLRISSNSRSHATVHDGHAIATSNMFEVSHEDAYDSDVDEGPHAATTFIANLSSTSRTNGATTIKSMRFVSSITNLTAKFKMFQLRYLLRHPAIIQRNKRNAKLEEENVLLKSKLSQNVESINTLKNESKKVVSEKKDLEERYLEEIVCLKTLGRSNPWNLKQAKLTQPTLYDGHALLNPTHTSVKVHDSEDSLVHAEKELSREQVYWLIAEELATQKSNPPKPVTPFVHPCRYLSGSAELKPVKAMFTEQIIPFYENVKQLVQKLDENIVTKVTEYMRIFDELDTDKDIFSIVLASDIVVPPSSNCLYEELRSNCDREHSKVVELEAEILKKQQMLNESEKHCAFIEKNHKLDSPQLKDTITYQLDYQNDGFKVENENVKRRVKPATGASKPMSKSDTRNHSTLPAKSEKARRVKDHHRNLNKKNHVDSCLNVKTVRTLKSVKSIYPKTPKAKHNMKTTKKVWKAKVVASVKPQWKPTGRHFTLYDKYPLTRIAEPIVEPLELTPCVSSGSKVTMISRVTDYTLSDQKAGSKGISGSTNCPLVSGFRMFTTYDRLSYNETVRYNGVVERRNRTLMEAARTMLIFAKAPLFLWAEANLNNNTLENLMLLCYPTNDYDDLGKLKTKADIAKQLEELFQPLFDDDEEFPPAIQIPPVRVNAALAPEIATGSPSILINTEDAPAAITSSSESQTPPPDTGVTGIETPLPTNDSDLFEPYIAPETASAASSSGTVIVDVTLNSPIIERKNLLIQNDCLIANSLEKDICSIMLAFDIVVPPSSNCLC
ncbi:hypothetical protein Tco_1101616 [Tanacetum coccineum]